MSELNSSIPFDLVSAILLKLPAKSIVRFRCVSKLWSSIITDPYFINSYKTCFRPKQSLLIFTEQKDKLVVFLFPQHERNLNGESSYSSQHVDRYQLTRPQYRNYTPSMISTCFSSMESVHGLIYLQTLAKPRIWNPSKRQFLAFPKKKVRGKTVFLGYDPIEDKHKLVCIPRRFGNECMVLTFGSSTSSAQELYWRRIETNLHHQPSFGLYSNERCINGVLYYKACLQIDDMQQQRVIMSFDVRSEKFQPISLPFTTSARDLFIAYEGKLAIVYSENNEKGIKMRVLEDAEKDVWSDKSFRVSFNYYDPILETSLKLSGVTDGGELIYVPSTFLQSFVMLYYDPKRDSFRKVVFEGIADDEFRLSNRLGNRPFYALHAFPNHINSSITW